MKQLKPGTGTILKKLLKVFELLFSTCKECSNLADVMDKQGPDWCRGNIEMILDKMHENAKRIGFPFVRSVAKRFVQVAIKLADRQKET